LNFTEILGCVTSSLIADSLPVFYGLITDHNLSIPSSIQHLSNDTCLKDKKGRLSELFCTVLCTTVVHSDMHTHMSSS